jgi:hypothetical protein
VLDLLHTLYSETSCLGHRIEEIQIIEDEKQMKLMVECQEIARSLFSLTESRDSWYSNKAHTELLQLKNLLKRQRFLLCGAQAMIDDHTMDDSDSRLPSLITDNSFLKCNLDRSYENIDLFVQDLARNTQTLNYICTMLEHSIESDVKMQNFMKQQSIVYQMLQLMSELVYLNPQNQKILMNKVGNIILQHLEKDSLSSNAILIIHQLINNNGEILNSTFMTHKVISILFQRMIKENKRPMRLAYLLYTVQQLAMLNHNSIRQNQSQIMSQLISNSMSSVFSSFRQSNLVNHLKREVNTPYLDIEYNNMKVKIVKPELCFLMSFLEVITICCFDKNPFAEKIAQSLISLREVEEILRMENLPALLEYEVCKFVYHVYIDVEKEGLNATLFESSEIVPQLIKIIQKCLFQFEQADSEGYYLTHKELVTIRIALYDLLRCSCECLRRIIDIGRKSSHHSHPEDTFDLTAKISELVKQYSILLQREDMIKEVMEPFLEYIKSNDKKTYFSKSTDLGFTALKLESGTIFTAKDLDAVTIDQSLRKQQLSIIFRGMNLNQKLQALILKIDNSNQSALIFKKQFGMFKGSLKFEEMAAKELATMISSKKTGQPFISEHLSNFFMSLVMFMDPKIGASEETIKIGLKIFREYSARYVQQVHVDASSRSRSELTNTQDFLISIGTVKLVCNLILEQDNLHIIDLALEVGSQMLTEGNRKGQTEFKSILQGQSNSTLILRKIEKVMLSSFESISRLMIAYNADQMRHIFFGETSHSLLQFKGFFDLIATNNKIMKFFKLLCEGHNADLQNFLREQQFLQDDRKSAINIDFVSHAVIMFGSFVKFFNRQCFETGLSLMEFLIECLQGPCKGNQDRVIKCKILDFCKDFINDLNGNSQDLISRGFDMNLRQHQNIINSLFNQTIKLLLSVIEFNMEPEVVNYLGSNIEFKYLMQRIKHTYLEIVSSLGTQELDKNLIWKIKQKVFSDEIQLGFNIFFFIKMIDDMINSYEDKITELSDLELAAYNFFKDNSGHLEVNFHGTIQKVYFMKHPACNYIDPEAQAKLMVEVRRDSANEKIADFLAFAPNLFNLMDHTFEMTTRNKIRPAYLSYVRTLALLVSFAINIYMFVYLSKDVRFSEPFDKTSDTFELSFSILGWVHLALGALMIVLQIMLKNKLIRLDCWRRYINKFSKEFTQKRNKDDYESRLVRSILEKDVYDITSEEMKLVIACQRRVDDARYSVPSIVYWTLTVEFIFMDSTLVYFLFYTLISGLANFQRIWLFYGFGLFDIIVGNLYEEQIRRAEERDPRHHFQQEAAAPHHVAGHHHHLHLWPLWILLPNRQFLERQLWRSWRESVHDCFPLFFDGFLTGPKVVRKCRRHDGARELQVGEPGQVVRALLLRRLGLHHRQHHAAQHRVRHHHRHVRGSPRQAHQDDAQYEHRLFRVLA